MEPLFPALPDDLSGLSDDELVAAIDARVATATRIHSADADLLGDMSAADVVAQMTLGVEQIEALRGEQTARAEVAANAQTQLAELAARVLPAAEPEPAPAVDPAPEPEPVVAAAPVPATRARVPLVRSRVHEPVPTEPERRTSIVAAADIPGTPLGSDLSDPLALARAFIRRRESIGRTDVGSMDKVLVAAIHRTYDEQETLRSGDTDGNWRKVRGLTSPQALAASGGLCAPRTPYYDLMQIAVASRPVRDSLPRFNADRGGIRFVQPPGLADVSDAIGIITEPEDAAGGTSALKSCQVVSCPQTIEVDVDILFHCLQFGNLGARTFPEQVAQFQELTMAAWARMAETNVLDAIDGASTQVTASATYGATASLLPQVLTAVAAYRSRHRMGPEVRLRAIFPDWAGEMLVTDLIRGQFDRFSRDVAGVEALLRSYGVEPTFTLDGPTGGGQVFGSQGAGALADFPSTMIWYLFSEGSFLWLDGGSLELGIVRDSVLNSTNDFTIFGESFESVAFIGVESLKITSTLCANGEVAAPASAFSCPAYNGGGG